MRGFQDEFDDVSLDLTPIIDVVFLLLIFFIMATTFSKPVLEVALAGAESAVVQENTPKDISLTIAADGTWHLGEEAIGPEDWHACLDAADLEAAVIFNVDKAAPFESFILALDAAKSRNRNTVVINAAPASPAAQSRP